MNSPSSARPTSASPWDRLESMTAHPALTVARSGSAVDAGQRARLQLAGGFASARSAASRLAILENCDELLATIARHQAGGAHVLPQDATEQAEHGVADEVPVLAVEQAEVIEIEHDRHQGVRTVRGA